MPSCIACGSEKWALFTLGIFLCLDCARTFEMLCDEEELEVERKETPN
jgi:hypothetical protein